MLQTFQIIALLQGIFLLGLLVSNKKKYGGVTFWLLIGGIGSVVLYVLRDMLSEVMSRNITFFYLDKSLFITFLVLFVKYQTSKKKIFQKRDLLFFIPNLLFFIIEILERVFSEGILAIDIPEIIIESSFLLYLLYASILILRDKSQKWMLFFIIPLILLIGSVILNEINYWLRYEELPIYKNHVHFGSYSIVIIAFLFYMITFKLVISPKKLLSDSDSGKYKNSALNESQIKTLTSGLKQLMEEGHAYKDSELSLQKIADSMSVPRAYISEVLNNHMGTSFQDYINSYRVSAFIKSLEEERFSNYTLLGIAEEVGFKSKATFNTAFKKFKGITPSEYKKTLKK